MKTFKSLLMTLMLLGGMTMFAQSYGKPYHPQYAQRQPMNTGVYSQTPIVEMHSTSALNGSGSALPQAALTGTYTADEMNASQSSGRHGYIKRDGDNPFGDETVGDIDNPLEPATPLGDAMLPLLLLACAYLIVRATRRRTLKG